MPRISVGLSPELAIATVAGVSDSQPSTELEQLVLEAGAELTPVQPNLDVEDLRLTPTEPVWFTCEVDDQVATDLANRLLDVEGVLAAFVVPPEGPP